MKKIPEISDYFINFKGNHKELADFLDTQYFYDDRLPKPTPLGNYYEFFRDLSIYYLKESEKIQKPPILELFEDKNYKKIILSKILFGIGVEALLKACYLKKGYSINKVIYKNGIRNIKFPTKLSSIYYDNTIKEKPKIKIVNFYEMIDNFEKIYQHDEIDEIKKWLTLARIWRNLHTHIGYSWGIDYIKFVDDKKIRRASVELKQIIDMIIEDFFGMKYKLSK